MPYKIKMESGSDSSSNCGEASSLEAPMHPPYILSNHMGSVHHRALPESETLSNLVTSGTEDRLLADSKPDVYFTKPLGCFQAGFKQEVCT